MNPIKVKIIQKFSHKNSIHRKYLRTSTGQYFQNVFVYIYTIDFQTIRKIALMALNAYKNSL